MSRRLALPAPAAGPASRMALWLIGLYQRRISPRKGFRCAHAVLHGGPGCSGFAARTIVELGLWRAIRRIRDRFRDCRTAFALLRTAKKNGDGPDDDPEAKKSCLWQTGGASCLGLGEGATGACAACDIGAVGCCG